jgi:hypothetical protein
MELAQPTTWSLDMARELVKEILVGQCEGKVFWNVSMPCDLHVDC